MTSAALFFDTRSPRGAEVPQTAGNRFARPDRHVIRSVGVLGEQLGKIESQGRNGDVLVVACVESTNEGVDGLGRFVHDPAVRRHQHVGPGLLDATQAPDQLRPSAEETVVVVRQRSLLEARYVPNSALVVNRIAAEDDSPAIHFDQVTDRSVGVAPAFQSRLSWPDPNAVPRRPCTSHRLASVRRASSGPGGTCRCASGSSGCAKSRSPYRNCRVPLRGRRLGALPPPSRWAPHA